MTCELLCEVFEREGFVARYAHSGEAAWPRWIRRGATIRRCPSF